MSGQSFVETAFRVRYAETDALGSAHHTAYLVWFEVGRSEFMWQRGSGYQALEAEGYRLPVVELEAQYFAPCRYGDRVVVRTSLDELRSRSLSFRYEVRNADSTDVLATGFTRHVCINTDGRVRRLPKWAADLVQETGSAR